MGMVQKIRPKIEHELLLSMAKPDGRFQIMKIIIILLIFLSKNLVSNEFITIFVMEKRTS